jgi:DNA repair protein RadA/Sms
MFICTKCDAQSLKWSGRCLECGAWGTLQEAGDIKTPGGNNIRGRKKTAPAAKVIDLSQASTQTAEHTSCGISEVDRVLGGGFVAGSVTLLAGEPGIGKSTLVAQLSGAVNTKGVYYASGEESANQVKLRFSRLHVSTDNVHFSNETNVEAIIAAAAKMELQLLIIDSIQTMSVDSADALPGTPTAVRAAAATLISHAKQHGVPVLLIGQVTKDGTVAGPKTLEHLVDTVLTLEGDSGSPYRLLRAVKHRFGSTEEIGVFEMTETGLQPVENPSARFLEERRDVAGSAIGCVMEGNRAFLVEIQALVDKSFYPQPIRRTSGYDTSRLLMLLAILSKRANIRLADHDVYVNVVGGLKVNDTGTDLAVAMAIVSAFRNIPLPSSALYVGEIGLGGELRSASYSKLRTKEIERLGFSTIDGAKTIEEVAAM